METQIPFEEQRLADIAKSTKYIPVLASYNLDYCCGGKLSLAEACRKKGLSVQEVAEHLRQGGTADANTVEVLDYSAWPMDILARHIVDKHHRYIETQTPELLRLTDKIAKVHGAEHPELLKVRDLFLDISAELAQHMKKEELILFPFIQHLAAVKRGETDLRRPGFGTVGNPVHMMETEHEDAGEILSQIRTLTSDYTLPEGACASYWQTFALLKAYEEDLHLHIHLENNLLFPAALMAEAELNTPISAR
jgi:regulator of cell morphogenesis and NO signaling